MKNKETLEEVADRETTFPKMCYPDTATEKIAKDNFIKGVKWQQERSYSEEEVLMIVNRFRIWSLSHVEKKELIEWFEQFKNN
jgi:hypothetical protein